METGGRGYGIAGQISFLEPDDRGEVANPAVLKDRSGRVLRPADHERLIRTRALIRCWQAEVTQPDIRIHPDRTAGAKTLGRSGQGSRRVADSGTIVTVAERGPHESRDPALTFNRETERIRDARPSSHAATAELTGRTA